MDGIDSRVMGGAGTSPQRRLPCARSSVKVAVAVSSSSNRAAAAPWRRESAALTSKKSSSYSSRGPESTTQKRPHFSCSACAASSGMN
eukprot:scaffold29049_cov79-Phaeocystis_antarctica.AAC.2